MTLEKLELIKALNEQICNLTEQLETCFNKNSEPNPLMQFYANTAKLLQLEIESLQSCVTKLLSDSESKNNA